MAVLVLAVLWLSGGCQGASDPNPNATEAANADTIPVVKLFALFPSQNLPLEVPNPNRDNSQLPPPDIQVYNAFLVGKDRLFPASRESAYVPYLRLTLPETTQFQALVMLEERPDGPHYWLCTVTSEGKLIDRREIAFARIATGVNHDRTATIAPDLTIEIKEILKQRTVARDSLELRRMGKPMVETVTNGKYSLQLRADGTFLGNVPTTVVGTAPADSTQED